MAELDDYVDVLEAAKALRIHPDSVRRLIRQRKLPCIRFGNKYLIERTKLEVFQAAYEARPGPKTLRRLL